MPKGSIFLGARHSLDVAVSCHLVARADTFRVEQYR